MGLRRDRYLGTSRVRFVIVVAVSAAVLVYFGARRSAAGTEPAPGGEPAAEPASVPARSNAPEQHCLHERRMWSHALGASYDVGSASAYGLGYQIGRLHTGDGYPDFFMLTHLGLGLDVAAITADHSRLDAMTYSLAARVAAVGGPGGLGLELRGGVADPRAGEALGFMAAGAFYSFFLLELGYSYQFPSAGSRPDWLSSHQFSLRIHVPVWRQGLVASTRCDR